MSTNNKKRKRKNINPQEKLTRKRIRNTTEWIDVKAKKLLNLGVEHTNRSGKKKNAKQMGTQCNCRMKCYEKVCE